MLFLAPYTLLCCSPNTSTHFSSLSYHAHTHTGTFQENTLALWSSQDYSLLTASTLASAVHEVQWDPYTAYEFTAVGAKASISFWVVEEEMREGRYQMKVC